MYTSYYTKTIKHLLNKIYNKLLYILELIYIILLSLFRILKLRLEIYLNNYNLASSSINLYKLYGILFYTIKISSFYILLPTYIIPSFYIVGICTFINNIIDTKITQQNNIKQQKYFINILIDKYYL
ncbi:hypothetical protein BaOVIS_035040 (apicoplast) [Babesia ovis]|uniref:Uncharacterized protein n=1 Tax=Babesia ovis TaxID=5869 RepID=A0A9W5WWB9_BABOV|nr:hypothetical protein BaOVIS_035040 [Babesia ovis]